MTTRNELARNLKKIAGRVWVDPVLVHSMGKVGSSSIFRSLQSAIGPASIPGRRRILHTHQLNRRTIDRFCAKVGYMPGHIEHALKFLSADVDGPVKLITPVRDPIARNVSAFFENLHEYGFTEDADGASLPKLVETFTKRYPHNLPATWFDAQVSEVFGIDVFAEPLDFSSGGHVIKGQAADILLLRLEDPLAIREDAIRRFVGLEAFRLLTLNEGERKGYGDMYRRFKEQFRPGQALVDRLYGSRFARHFYSDDELEALCDQWLR